MFMYAAAIAVAIVSKRSATRDDDVGLEELEHRRQLEQAEPGRLRHRRRVLALDDEADRRIGPKPSWP